MGEISDRDALRQSRGWFSALANYGIESPGGLHDLEQVWDLADLRPTEIAERLAWVKGRAEGT